MSGVLAAAEGFRTAAVAAAASGEEPCIEREGRRLLLRCEGTLREQAEGLGRVAEREELLEEGERERTGGCELTSRGEGREGVMEGARQDELNPSLPQKKRH